MANAISAHRFRPSEDLSHDAIPVYMVMPSVTPSSSPLLSIGAVSRETGVAVETLRTWERRYGFPSPQRTDSGHRVYARETVDKLILVSKALAAGHRAAQVVPASIEELRRLLEASRGPADLPANDFSLDEPMASWVEAAAALDGETLDAGFRSEWNKVGAMVFLQERATPFLDAIGVHWAEGRIGVLHEHFASERLRDFLAGNWRPISDQQRGPLVICACLPEERHHLTLHMISVIVVMAGCRVIFLGADTPLEDIDRGARQADPAAVFISVSRAADPRRARRRIEELRRLLDANVHLVIGGAGAPDDHLPGVAILPDLRALSSWVQELVKSCRRI